jgi:hypothetical protein
VDARVCEEDLVELCLTSHLAKRTNIDRRVFHIDNKCSESSVLDSLRISTHD